MNCGEAHRLIEAYHDRELDSSASGTVAQHVADCPQCSTSYEQLLTLSHAARDLRASMPPSFEATIRSAVRADVDDRRSRSLKLWRTTALAACLVAALSVTESVSLKHPSSPTPAGMLLADEVITTHVRSLLAGHLLDVPSSDQHTVKPWFAGKIDFSPDVRDFATQGYMLLGGRLEYLNHRNVAALVYVHGKHFINAYTWPGDGKVVPVQTESHDGFHILRWSDGVMVWCLVSDAGGATLSELKKLIESKNTATSPAR